MCYFAQTPAFPLSIIGTVQFRYTRFSLDFIKKKEKKVDNKFFLKETTTRGIPDDFLMPALTAVSTAD